MSKEKLKRGEHPIDWKKDCPKFKEYYSNIHPDWDESACILAAKKFCRSINWQCVEFYQKKYPNKTLAECEELRQNAINSRKTNSPAYIQYYQKRYPELSYEEHKKMLEEYSVASNYLNIAYYQKRYPELSYEEHKKMLECNRNIYIKTLNDVSGENNPMHRSKTTDLQRRQISPKCIEFYQKRYPDLSDEEHKKMLESHLSKVNIIMKDKTKQVKCIEYWLSKGYNENEAKLIISKSQNTFSLEKCIEKYGIEKGTKRFEQRQEKWVKSLRNNFYKYGDNRTPTSNFANNIIKIICNKICIDVPTKEKYMTDNNGNNYAYDFCHNKKIIEFNGDYWHMNPKIYKPTDINKTKKLSAKEIWDKDNIKIKCAESHGYKVLVIWESEYNKSKYDTIKKCMDFLTS